MNLLILSNREAHADVIARLRVDDVKRHKDNRIEWEARKAAWRRLRHEHAILTLKSYLHSPEVIAPAQQAEVLSELAAGQQAFHETRVEITNTLSRLNPPVLTKAEAGKVRTQLEELLGEERAAAEHCMVRLHQAEKAIASEVGAAAQYLRARLEHFAADPPAVIEVIFVMQIRPLIALRAEQATDLLSRIARAETRQRLKLHEDALTLTARFEGAGRIFDEHAEATKELYSGLRSDLAQLRADHEAKDKERELQLEESLMTMRRASDKDGLMAKQDEAMKLLHEIQTGYRDFHALSLERIGMHPAAVSNELEALYAGLVGFHHVKTREDYEQAQPAAPAPAEDVPAEPEPEPEAEPAEGGEGEEGEEGAEAAPAPADDLDLTKPLEGEEDLWATFGMLYPARMSAQVALDDELAGLEAANRHEPLPDPYAFMTDGNAEYQMLSPAEVAAAAKAKAEEAAAAAEGDATPRPTDPKADGKADPKADPKAPPAEEAGEEKPTFEMPVEISDQMERAAALLPRTYAGVPCLAPLVAPEETAVVVALASGCISYHEKHDLATADRAAAEHATLEKQLTRELDERLMAHRPRAGHVETDMAAQRDMELLAHRERFVRHVKTLNGRREMNAQALEDQVAECSREEEKHLAKLKAIQRALGSERNNHTATLQRLSREAEAAHKTYTEFMQDSYDGLKHKAEMAKGEVLHVNSRFRASWKPFAAGGQFNEEERDRFIERLAKVDAQAEGEAGKQGERLGELQESQLTRAATALEEFRKAFTVNLDDITHIEQMKMQQGKATADVRIVLAESAAQQTSIDGQTDALETLLRNAKRGAAASGDDEPSTSGEDPVSMRVLHASARMRELLLQRAKFLNVISATAMPESCLPILRDPAEEGAEGEAAKVEPTVVTAMSALVQQAREKHEAEMIRFCEEYHAQRGERAVTRPSFIPDNVDDHKAKVQGILDNLISKAEDERLASVKALRLQLLSIWRLLNLMGATVFDDISVTARTTAASACEQLDDDYKPLAKDREKKREMHQAALKPTLCNAGKQAELRALAQAEGDRSAAATAAASQLRSDMLAVESEQAGVVVRRLVHQSTAMLSLLDAMIAQEDLIPADEPPEDVHHGLKKKLRMETREMALDSSADKPQEGRAFVTHIWSGLPTSELTPENAVSLTEGASPAPAEGAEPPPPPELSAQLSSNMTRAHRSVISARDRVYAAYRLHYAGRVRAINATCEQALSEERQWKSLWKQLVNRAAIEPIDD